MMALLRNGKPVQPRDMVGPGAAYVPSVSKGRPTTPLVPVDIHHNFDSHELFRHRAAGRSLGPWPCMGWRQRSRSEWQGLVSGCERSSLTQAVYCPRHGIFIGSLQRWWRISLKQMAPTRHRRKAPPQGIGAFRSAQRHPTRTVVPSKRVGPRASRMLMSVANRISNFFLLRRAPGAGEIDGRGWD